MITIGYSTRDSKPQFINYIKETCGIKDVQVIEKINPNGKSLTKVYNEILEESLNDIVILCHDDILFEKKYWAKRIVEHFEKKDDYGILGVAGTRYYPKSGMWWEISSEMIGQVYHQHEGKKWLSAYNEPFGNKIIDSVIVDGLFIALHKNRIQKTFDESVDGFHFYDTTFCFQNFLSGVRVGIISNVPITHLSIGMTNQKWEDNRKVFSEKFSSDLPKIINQNNLPVFKINEKQPLVSVIMPIYNYGKMFQKSLESVFKSTYTNIELIIVNDGSTDEYVLNKLKTLSDHPNIKIINKKNSGPASARNEGIKNSKGTYILPLDSDDTISPEYIKTCVSILSKDNNVSPVYCDTNHVGEINGIEYRPEWSKERLLQGPFIVNCSMFSKEAFDSCDGGYDEEMKGWEDYELWVRMMLNGFVGKRIPKPMFNYFHHEKDGTVSTTANKNHQELYDYIIDKNFKKEKNVE
jgi:glycosyltransferase involved in cell wall biosynthesis